MATVRKPRSVAARKMRMAISERFAAMSFLNGFGAATGNGSWSERIFSRVVYEQVPKPQNFPESIFPRTNPGLCSKNAGVRWAKPLTLWNMQTIWRRKYGLALMAALAGFVAVPLQAQKVPVVEKQLSNGMRLLMVVRHDEPTV